uniref:CSON012856 protein n=1 Tax=Culicoides sonorensis TaxID=179676 RepID=A0A336LN89_CULSO
MRANIFIFIAFIFGLLHEISGLQLEGLSTKKPRFTKYSKTTLHTQSNIWLYPWDPSNYL